MANLGTYLFEAARISDGRGVATTSKSTQELRDAIAADVRARSVFSARAANAVFVSKIKEVVTAVSEGTMDEATARWLLLETLRSTGYTPEGGFPEIPEGKVPPAVAGTLEDLSSKRRFDFIIRTQVDLLRGARDKAQGMSPTALRLYPAWELVRIAERRMKRNWGGKHQGTPPKRGEPDLRSRWEISGGKIYGGRLIALKGDPIFGELSSSSNFDDGLDVDYSPLVFGTGMWMVPVAMSVCVELGVTGPGGESIAEWFSEERAVLGGMQPPVVAEPQVSMRGVDTEIRKRFESETGAVMVDDTATTADGAQRVRNRLAELQERRKQRRRNLLEK